MAIGKIVGLREQNKLATRRELARFGIELFMKQGFANTTVEQIVEPLGIAKRTFFRYFNAKEDLLFAWFEDLTPGLVQELKSRPAAERPFKAVCETLASLLKFYDASPEWALGMMHLSKQTPALECEKRTWEDALVSALIEREGKRAMSPLKARIAVGTALVAFTAALDEWYAGGGHAKLRPIVEKAFSLVGDL